jgi:FkbM family methyltransferase
MSFTTYAQNFEDVMLWRALKPVEDGFYIDVGAWSPDLDSVTRAFYEHGWRGINVEPNPESYAQFRARRPRDINVRLAVSDTSGTQIMNFLSNSGLSTLDDNIAQEHACAGLTIDKQVVVVTTLANLWEQHVPEGHDVHFLKVDVEGSEEAVLRGNDWSRYRPWIVVVEATLPMSQQESHDAWEPPLLTAGYHFAYADGLNRYYVANEHAELLPAFKYPPNVFDGFKSNLQRQAEARANEAEDKAQKAQARAHALNCELKATYASYCWRITFPLRSAFDSFFWLRAMLSDILQTVNRCTGGLLDPVLSIDDNNLIAPSPSVADAFYTEEKENRPPRLFVDVSSVIQNDHLTGIQRVTRAICTELLKNPQKIDIELVYTTPDDPEFYRANVLINKILEIDLKCASDELIEFCRGDILLFLDLHPGVAISHRGKIQFLRNKGVRVYHVVHDILPMSEPEFFWPDLCSEFHKWLLAISKSDGAICVSRATAEELLGWLKANTRISSSPFKIGWFHNGADIENSIPSSGLTDDAKQVIAHLASRPSFLMVGTIEPRKGYAQTLAAFDMLWADGLDANLVIVGKQGWMLEKLIDTLRRHPEQGKRLFWLEGISDEYLETVYAGSTCLVAASEGEGFGLPLVEAAQYKLPIIARDIPIFHEVAGDHAFYFNGKKPDDLARAVIKWLELYQSGRHPKSDDMPWLTWKQSTQQLLDIILEEKWQFEWPDQKAGKTGGVE